MHNNAIIGVFILSHCSFRMVEYEMQLKATPKANAAASNSKSYFSKQIEAIQVLDNII